MDIHTQENNLQSQCETESSIDIIFHEVIRKITGAKATEGKERLVQILQALKDNFILELKDVIDMAQKIKEDDINSMLNQNYVRNIDLGTTKAIKDIPSPIMKKIEVNKNEEISQGLLKHQTSSWKKNRAKKHLLVHSESYKNSLERKVENSVFKKHIEIIETSVEGGKKYKWRCRICHANGKELILQENREGSSNFSKHFLGKSHKKKEIKLCESVQEQRIFKINVVSLGEKKTIFCDCGIQAIKCNNQTGVFFGCGNSIKSAALNPNAPFNILIEFPRLETLWMIINFLQIINWERHLQH